MTSSFSIFVPYATLAGEPYMEIHISQKPNLEGPAATGTPKSQSVDWGIEVFPFVEASIERLVGEPNPQVRGRQPSRCIHTYPTAACNAAPDTIHTYPLDLDPQIL